jgi:type IV pilus assembly protein PilM
MLSRTKTVVGLDVGSYSVKAVALQTNKDRITLQGYAQARIGTNDPGSVVRQVLDDLGVKPKRLVTSVSGRSVIVRQVETPKLGQDELKAHIAYEADKYIPFGADEVIIDCQTLPDHIKANPDAKATTMQVLLVAVRRGFVEDHINMLRSIGVTPEIIDVDVFALSNAYELLGPGKIEGNDGATALIDIGASKSNIAIVKDKRLLFTREVYLAGNEITDAIVRTFNEPAEDVERIKSSPGEALEALIDAAMPAFEDLANEIRLSFDYVEGQFEQQVSTVVLTGGTSQLVSISEILSNILGRPVHVFDPLAGMDLVPSHYDLHSLDASSPSLTIALGLAAHLLSGTYEALGGLQSHGWQPRNAGDHPRQAQAAGEQAEEQPQEVEQQFHQTSATMMAPLNMPQQPLAESLEELPGPPASDIIPQQRTEAVQKTTSRHSGLVVVLDDDQEMPKSDRIGKGTKRVANPLKVEGFDNDEDGDKKLPTLPKI